MSQEPDIGAPEGATCAEHRDRMALFKCPRCGRNACLTCFHAPVARCVTCMRRDPTEASRTLWFAAGEIIVQGAPTQQMIALDVARAIAVQVGLSAIELLSLLLPFASLVAAYAPERKEAAIRLVLYRFWLGPAAALLGQAA